MADSMALELVTGNALEMIQKAEIRSQIDIAKDYPRSMEDFKKRAITMATLDEETAASCIYHRPVGKDRDGKMQFADGMSIRMAEIVGACYGNLRVGAILIEQTERKVVARGAAHDLESNFASSSEIVESTVDSKGNPYSERMAVVVAKAALAKARRDATFMVVPRALAKPVEQAVRQLLLGNAKSIDTRRQGILGWIKSLNIDPARVWTVLEVKGPNDIGVNEIEVLMGIATAIKDKEVTIDEAFPIKPLKVSEGPKGGALSNLDNAGASETVRQDPAWNVPAETGGSPKPEERPTESQATDAAGKPKVGRPRKGTEPASKPATVDTTGNKSEEDLVKEYLLWVEQASEEQLFEEPCWLMTDMKGKIKNVNNQLKVLRPFNARRQELRPEKFK